jgi:signal transduction histidine kinase
MMPGMDGLSMLDQLLKTHPNVVCIVITGYATIESAVDAMKHGAFDFLPKPFTPDELRVIVTRGLDQRKLLLETAALREEKRRMQQYFISIVAHELRSPLLLVKQYLDLIVGGKMGTVDEVAGEMLAGAHSTLTGLLSIIADWLKLARIDAGDIAGGMEEVDVRTILEKVVEELKPRADEASVTLRLDRSLPSCSVTAHADALSVVFRNLVSNAIKYNKPAGTVVLEGTCIDGNLRVDVMDTGMGIPEAEIPFIFEDFFRVKNSKTAEIPGTGLGLSIVKKIVEGHHGSVEVESTEGEGTSPGGRSPGDGHHS